MDKTKIKVVKSSEVKAKKQQKRSRVPNPRASAREMVSTVSEWVVDLKQRKTEETRKAIEALFAAKQQPGES